VLHAQVLPPIDGVVEGGATDVARLGLFGLVRSSVMAICSGSVKKLLATVEAGGAGFGFGNTEQLSLCGATAAWKQMQSSFL
jgi:hypothetical protein